MNIEEMINRHIPPLPWDEGEKIPWHEAEFSQRMLKEHLSQRHDAASRRLSLIEQHIAWIERTFLHKKPSRVLDLGCGPGLYLTRLAQRGYDCVGIDFAPASLSVR